MLKIAEEILSKIGLSQRKLAIKLGFTQASVSRVLAGEQWTGDAFRCRLLEEVGDKVTEADVDRLLIQSKKFGLEEVHDCMEAYGELDIQEDRNPKNGYVQEPYLDKYLEMSGISATGWLAKQELENFEVFDAILSELYMEGFTSAIIYPGRVRFYGYQNLSSTLIGNIPLEVYSDLFYDLFGSKLKRVVDDLVLSSAVSSPTCAIDLFFRTKSKEIK